MLKNISRLESKVAEKTAHLYLDSDTPLNVVKEMLFQFIGYVGQLEKHHEEARLAAEAAKEEVVVPEEIIIE